ncbi:putative PurR-regulated permease PerM [Psychromicrobium silvestre]|uniref:Putative PurR-regulated permease PerM n=1 Tax=Psychromicrobium silvestre TaxID=1645614 RepID=A0A7Y9S6U5_9MICC|nr:putative PurR-regulated permease PerM [Psychromicrobium silvestre]
MSTEEHPESSEESPGVEEPKERQSSNPLGKLIHKLAKPIAAEAKSALNVPEPEELASSGAAQYSVVQRPIYFGFMLTLGVGIALGLYFMATSLTQLLTWMLTALFISLGLDPVVRFLQARKIPRPAGIVITLTVLVAAVGGFFATLIPTIVTQTTQLIDSAPGWIQDFLNSDFFKQVDSQFNIRDRLNEEVQKFFSNSSAVGGVFGGVVNVGTTVANGLFGTLIVVVLSLYFLASLPAMKRWGYKLAPRSRRPRVEGLTEEITRSVGNYVIGQAAVAVLNAIFAFIVMSILGVPFSILLAFLVALLAFIPLVGGVIALVLVSLVALTASWQTAVIYLILYVIYLQFEAYFVSPRIMQRAVSVPGAVVVIAVIAGGSLLGVLGALIAIPTAAAIMLLIREIFIVRQDRR